MPLGQWFTLEIIAEGDHFTVLVDGKKTTDTADDSIPGAGFIYLGVSGNGNVEFRKIEIKELADIAAPPVVAPPADGFVQLFNGKDLTGWKEDKNGPGTWRVLNGNLASGGGGFGKLPSTLLTEKPLPKDFHLRMELRSDRSEGAFRLRANAENTSAYESSFTYGGPNGTLRGGAIFAVDPNRSFQFKASTDTDIRKGDWFTVEFIFDGNRLISKINGITKADITNNLYPDAGHFGVRPFSIFPIEFRKIEVKAANAGRLSRYRR